jgi:hypothetical protein
MKRSTHRLGATLSLLLALAPDAYATSSVDLSIRGLVAPSACTPSLSNGGAPASGLTLTDEVPLDGSATAELFYL